MLFSGRYAAKNFKNAGKVFKQMESLAGNGVSASEADVEALIIQYP